MVSNPLRVLSSTKTTASLEQKVNFIAILKPILICYLCLENRTFDINLEGSSKPCCINTHPFFVL